MTESAVGAAVAEGVGCMGKVRDSCDYEVVVDPHEAHLMLTVVCVFAAEPAGIERC